MRSLVALTLMFVLEDEDRFDETEDAILDHVEKAYRPLEEAVPGISILKAFTFEGGETTASPSRETYPNLDLTNLLVHGEDPINAWMLSEAHPKSYLRAALERIEEKLGTKKEQG